MSTPVTSRPVKRYTAKFDGVIEEEQGEDLIEVTRVSLAFHVEARTYALALDKAYEQAMGLLSGSPVATQLYSSGSYGVSIEEVGAGNDPH